MSQARACWCGGATAAWALDFETAFGNYAMLRCDRCGVMALHPPPSDLQLAAAYAPEYYGATGRKFVGPVAAVIGWFQQGRARAAQRHMPAGGTLLDVGCGNGGFLRQMKRRGFSVLGTEWSAAAAARAAQHHEPIEVRAGQLLELKLPAARFDMVTLWHVFEHLREPDRVLAEIGRLLKPDGVLMMSMPNVESDQALRFGRHWLHHDPPRHLFGFGPSSLGRLLDQAGFVATDLHTRSLEQNPFGYLQSWLNQRAASRGQPRDQLYQWLKGLRRMPARDAALAVALMPWALLVNLHETRQKRGATMTVTARRRT